MQLDLSDGGTDGGEERREDVVGVLLGVPIEVGAVFEGLEDKKAGGDRLVVVDEATIRVGARRDADVSDSRSELVETPRLREVDKRHLECRQRKRP